MSKPMLRFEGFSDDWEKKKLGDMLNERKQLAIPSEKNPLVSFTVEKGVTPKSDRYDREFLVKDANKKYKVTVLDDIVYNPANLKFGAIARNDYGRAVFSPIYVTLEAIEDNAKFIGLYVTRQSFIERSLMYQEGTVYERKAVKPKDLLSMGVSLPTPEEQTLIGNFFKTIDDLILAQEQAVKTYGLYKEAMLQKMFPKKGQVNPDLRFEGFSDDWEEKKLGEMLKYEQPTKYLVDSSDYDDKHHTPVLTAGKSFILGYTDETHGVYNKGDMILFDDFTTAFQYVDFPFKVKSSATKFLTPTDSNNLLFLFNAMKGIQYPTDDHKRYWISEYSTLSMLAPSLPEQELIGNFFKTLDETIEGHQVKLDKYKEMKESFLQKMFI